MSNEDQPEESEFLKHATAALKHTGAAASEAATSTLKGLKKALSWENFGQAIGGAAMVGAAAKAASAVAARVSKTAEKEPESIHSRRYGYRR